MIKVSFPLSALVQDDLAYFKTAYATYNEYVSLKATDAGYRYTNVDLDFTKLCLEISGDRDMLCLSNPESIFSKLVKDFCGENVTPQTYENHAGPVVYQLEITKPIVTRLLPLPWNQTIAEWFNDCLVKDPTIAKLVLAEMIRLGYTFKIDQESGNLSLNRINIGTSDSVVNVVEIQTVCDLSLAFIAKQLSKEDATNV